MERLIEYCKATTKEIESSFVLNFARTELQKFNGRVDTAYAHALKLDRMTRESFLKMIPKDENNTPSYYGKEYGDPVDGPKSRGRILEFLKRHGRKNRELEKNNETDKNDLGGKRLDAISGENGEQYVNEISEDDDGHFVPRKLLLFKVEVFKGEDDGSLGVRKSTKKFRAPVPNTTRTTATEDSRNDGDERMVGKSTKKFRAPAPNSTRSNLEIVDDERRVVRKSTKTFRAPVPNSTPTGASWVDQYTQREEKSPSFRHRVKKFLGFR